MSTQTQAFEDLLEFLRTQRGFDFTGYKRSTLTRRIRKRMQDVGIEEYALYQDRLEMHPEEFEALFNTILINVTSFFRDPEAWAYLREKVIPLIVKRVRRDEHIRVWSAGCASGEEAYTLAIAFAEEMGIEQFKARVKIYATDADAEALAQARQGVYPEKGLESVPEDLRDRYFDRAGGRYAFRNDLRRNIIFGQIDLVQNAPISRLSLLSCRNTLMYFNADVQARILARFHFALKDEGYLFLGKAEMLLTHAHLFRPIDLQTRIFEKVKKGDYRDRLLVLTQAGREDAVTRGARDVRLRDAAFDAAPVAQIVLDRDDQLAVANAQAREFFGLKEQDLGRPFKDLELSYRPVELRSVIDEVRHERAVREISNIQRFRPDGVIQWMEVQVVPLVSERDKVEGVSVIFRDVSSTIRLQEDLRTSKGELETAYEELQSTNEELETTNEELQSTIEELETTNEELQSTNEELETMNEELQSTNEELETMNEELRMRTDEASRLNELMESIFTSLQGGVVVLDRRLRVTLWSGRARDLWGLLGDEVIGETFFDLDIGLPRDGFRTLIEACRDGEVEMGEVTVDAINRRGRDIRCRVLCSPLRAGGEVVGVILMMEDWTARPEPLHIPHPEVADEEAPPRRRRRR